MITALRRRRSLLGALVGGTVALAACGGLVESEFTFVQSADRKAFFKVPAEWERFTKRDLLLASGQSLSEATDQAFPWLIAFDGDPNPSVEHVLRLADAPDHPVVLAQAQVLDFSSRDQFSLGSIRNQFYRVDQLLDSDQASIRSYEELVLEGGFRGVRIEYDVVPQGVNTVAEGSDVIRVAQVGILDPATENLYLLAIRCESHCFRDNRSLIDQILDSWTVKER